MSIILIFLILLPTMESDLSPNPAASAFEARAAALRARVADAARILSEQGIKPTVARIRAALGGGSPNDLGPALKAWRETARFKSDAPQATPRPGRIPPPIADLAQELWQRATAAAVLEVKHGPTAQVMAARTGEIQGLRSQLSAVREQLERESRAYGELRAQAARHETIAQQALVRAEQAETRARDLLRELGETRQEMAQFTAGVEQRRLSARPVAATRHAAVQNQSRPTSRSKRKRRSRTTSPLRQREGTKKHRSQRLKATSKTAMISRKRAVGIRSTSRGHR
jgi:hypothetical protein